jgi:methylthioribose-1-phosphate isomerase
MTAPPSASAATEVLAPPPVSAADFSPLAWRDGALLLLDQTRLPAAEVWLACRTPEDVAAAIRRLAVRGAPAIGVAAAYGLALGMAVAASTGAGVPGDVPGDSARQTSPNQTSPNLNAARRTSRDLTAPDLTATGMTATDLTATGMTAQFTAIAHLLGATRPTAVNLRWALDQGRRVFAEQMSAGPGAVAEALLAWAHRLAAEDVQINRRIGEHGAALFEPHSRVLTHCNAGALATAGYGTALGVIQSAWRRQAVEMVWVDETRPLLQGARLTAWELKRLGIPYRLVTDSSAGTLLAQGLVDRIVVGADRIAANGDTANKIGTYTVAVLAARHGVPFYVAAPLSTIDPGTPDGAAIPIERRRSEEVTELFGARIAPHETEAVNFAFDVTPHDLITAIITEAGILLPPYDQSIAAAFAAA